MKKFAFLLLISCLFAVSGFAQTVAAGYLQTKTTSGTYIAAGSLTGTTNVYAANWDGSVAGTAATATMPFTFYFNGTGYGTCYVNPNGYITFGTASTVTNYTPLSAPTSGVAGTIAALGCNYLKSVNAIVSGVSGTAPNRIFTIQWTTAKFGTAITGCSLSFEINLYETTNKVEVVYSAPSRATPNSTLNTQVGIEGTATTDFLDWTCVSSSTSTTANGNAGFNWALPKPGSLASNTCLITENQSYYYPAANLQLDWTPNVALLNPSAITHTGFTANWATVAAATSYKVEVSTVTTFASYVGGTPTTVTAPTTSLAITGLTTGTKYYYRVTPIYAISGFTSASVVSSITMPVGVPALLNSSSFNYDVICNGGNTIADSSITVFNTFNGFDHAGYTPGSADFYNNGSGLASFPVGGSVIESGTASTAGIVYQMAPYNQNNAYYFASGASSYAAGTLTLTTPVAATNLYVAYMSAGTGNTATITITFNDATTQVFSGNSIGTNWCSNGNAFAEIARANLAAASQDNFALCEYLEKFSLAISAANYNKQIVSVNVQMVGATTANYFAVFGLSVSPTPTFAPSVSSLTAFATTTCTTPATAQSFTLTGNNLVNSTPNVTGTGNITAVAPLGYKVSADNITWGKTALIPYTNCAIAALPVYARLDTNLAGTYTGKIGFIGGSVPAATLAVDSVAVTGTVSGISYKAAGASTYPSAISTIYLGHDLEFSPSTPVVDSFSGAGLTGNVTLTSSNPDILLSLDGVAYASSVTLTATGSVISPAVAVYAQATPTVSGSDVATITLSGGATGCPMKDSVYGVLACVNPSAPTALTFPSTAPTTTQVSFTPSGTTPDGYLLVRSFTAFSGGSDPITMHQYAVNDTFGNGKVLAVYTTAPPYSITGLTANSQYYYTIVPFNGGTLGYCASGPLYPTGTQLTGSVITCPVAPASLTTSSVNSMGFTLGWSSSLGAGASAVNYIVDVATSNTFATGIATGSPFTVTGPAVSLAVTGLSPTTTYYYRVTAVGACNTASTVGSVATTTYNYIPVTINTAGFTGDGICEGTGNPSTTSQSFGTNAWDGGGYSFVAQNFSYGGYTPTTGYLPNTGLVSSAITSGVTWQLASYTGANVLRQAGSAVSTSTLTFTTPTYASSLYVLGTASNGGVTLSGITITYSDASTQTFPSWAIGDWFGSGAAVAGIGRIAVSNGAPSGTAGSQPDLYQNILANSTYNLPITSISFTTAGTASSNAYTGIFAVSARVGLLSASTATVPAFGNVALGCTSSAQSFTVAGSSLFPSGGSIVATAPTGFQVSSDGTTWGTTATLIYSGNAMSGVTVYSRFVPTALGAASGNITFAGGTVNTSPSVAVSGTGVGVQVTPLTTAAFGPINEYATSASQTYSITASGLTAGTVTIATSNPDFEISPDGVTWYTTNYTFSAGTSFGSTPIYIEYNPNTLGAETANITVTTTASCNPTITATGYGANPCAAPTAGTGITFPATTSTGTNINFTTGGPQDGYLVLQGTSAFLGTPTTGTNYTVGTAITGGGTVVGVFNGSTLPLTITTSGAAPIVPNTTYNITVIPFNGGPTGTCTGGPVYAASYLAGTYSTCPGIATGITSSAVTGAGFTLNWTAPTGGSANPVYYILKVSSDPTFTTGVTTSLSSSTTATLTGLYGSTTYYYKIYDSTVAGISGYSTVGNVTTGCGITPMPYLESFESIASNNTLPACMAATNLGGANVTYTAATGSYNQTPHTGSKFASFYYYNNATFAACNDWFFTPSFNFVAGNTYKVSFWYVTDGYGGWLTLKAAYGTSQTAAAMTTNVGTPLTNVTNTTYAQYTGTFTAATTGNYNVGIYCNSNTVPYYLTIDDIQVQALPSLSPSTTTLNVGSNAIGYPVSSSFTLSGNTLTAGPVTITAPTNFKVSNDGVTWGTTTTISYTAPTLSSTTVYVQCTPPALGVTSGTLTCVGGGATTNVTVSGTGVNPALAASPTSLGFGSVVTLTTSVAQTFNLSGTYLTSFPGNITLTSTNTDYQLSSDGGSTYHTTVTVPYTSGTLSATPVYVNYTPSALGASTGSITLSGAGAPTPPSVSLSGTGVSGPCGAPDVPTSVSFSSISTTAATANITDAIPASGYIVVASIGALTGGTPIDNTIYTPGSTLGSGTVVGSGTSTTIATTSPLVGNTIYTLTAFPYNSGTCAGPVYNTTTAVSGTITTCPGVATGVTSSAVTGGGFTLNWTAPTGGSANTIYYVIDASTSATFASGVTSYITTATTYSITGLYGSSTYYYRIHDSTVACTSAYTATGNITTSCGTTPMPYLQNFESLTTANTWPSCMTSTNLGTYTYTLLANNTTHNQIAHSGTKFASFEYGCNDYMFTPQFNFIAGNTYQVSFWYVCDGLTGFAPLEAAYGTSQTAGAMTTIIGTPVNNPTNTSYQQYVATFTPAVTGNYYVGIYCVGNFTPWYLSIDDIQVQALPSLIASPTALNLGSIDLGFSNTSSFSLSGTSLVGSADTITAPTGYQVSLSAGSGFASTIYPTFTAPTESATTIYVKGSPTAVGLSTGNVVCKNGFATVNVAVTDTGVVPGLTVTPTSLAMGSVVVGTPSVVQTFTLGGTFLTGYPGNITLTSTNTDYQVSTDGGSTWHTTVTVPFTAGYLPAVTISVQYTPSTTGASTGSITTSGGAVTTPPSVALTGYGSTGPCASPDVPTSVSASGTTSTATTVTISDAIAPTGYIVVASAGALTGTPTAYTSYTAGSTIGSGTVVGTGTTGSITTTSALAGNTTYVLTVFPYNVGTCAGPIYNTTTPVTTTITTCAGSATAISATATVTGLTATWTAPAGGSANPIYYIIDVSTSATFASGITSYVATSSPYTVTGLSGTTTYYYRLHDSTVLCTSGYSSTGNITTASYCSPTFPSAPCNGVNTYYTTEVAIAGNAWYGALSSCGTSNYTSQIFPVTAGTSSSLYVTNATYCGAGVWIDLNNNGSFLDAGELIYNGYAAGAGPGTYSSTFTVPTSIPAGNYRIRVIAGWGTDCNTGTGGTGPCGASGAGGTQYQYGNFDDFTLQVTNPQLTASTTSLAGFGTLPTCTSSSAQTFIINANGLLPAAGNIVAHAPTGFQVSTNGTAWDTVATYAYTGGVISSKNVYVRFAPTTPGSASGNITFYGGSDSLVTAAPAVAVSGTGNGLTATPTTTAAFGPIAEFSTSSSLTYSVSGSGLTPGTITVATSNPDFPISPDGVTWYTTNYTFSTTATLGATPIYIEYNPNTLGAETSNITVTSTTGCNPVITATGNGSNPCAAPTAPTGISFSGTGAHGTTTAFTAGSTPDGYLVLQGSGTFTGTPVNGTNYTVGTVITGGGTVVGVYPGGTSPLTIVTSGAAPINSNTAYNITIIPYNGGPTGTCTGGPTYATTYLQGTYTTCPDTVTSLASSAITGSGFTLNWSAPAATGSAATIYYVVDVSTTSAFTVPTTTTFITTGTTYTPTGLYGNQAYYYRIHDSTTVCTSGYTQTRNVTTACGIAAFPYSESFESLTSNNTLPSCMAATSLGTHNLTYISNPGGPYNRFAHTGAKFASYASGSADWYFTPAFNFVAGGTYTVSYWYITDGTSWTTLKSAYGTTATSAGMTTTIGTLSGVANTTYAQATYTFTAPTTGTYYVGIYGAGSGTAMCIDDISVTQVSTLIAAPTSLAMGTADVGFSNSGYFILNGIGLTTGPLTVTAPAGFQVASSATGTYGSTLSVSYTVPTLSNDTVFVKFAPSAATAYSGNITCAGGSATTVNVAVTGTGVVQNLAVSPSSLSLGTVLLGSTSVAQTFSLAGTYLTGYPGNVTLTSTDPEFQISSDGGSTYHTTVTVPYTTATLASSNIYVNYTPTAASASTGSITISGGGASTPPSVSLTGNGANSACTTPDVPTSVAISGVSSTTATATVTDAITPAGYIAVASVGTLSGAPVVNTTYAVGNTIGTGTVVSVGTSATLALSGLASNTAYTITIFPYNSGISCAGPVYNTATPVSGTLTTCPGIPGTPVASSLSTTGFILSWAAPTGGAASVLTYSIDVSTSATFTGGITGSPFTSATTSLPVGGLTANTTYYYRVRAVGSCTSGNSVSASTVTNTYPYVTAPISSGFNYDLIAEGTLSPSVTTNNGTVGFDGSGYVWVSQDYNYSGHTPSGTYYLPSSGAFTSANTTGLPYQLAPYNGNNFLWITANSGNTGTLTFTTPFYASQLYMIGSTGSGTASGITMTVTFTDLSTQVFTGNSFGDWYSSTPIAIASVGRIPLSTAIAEGTSAGPNFYELPLAISTANMTKQIKNIVVSTVAGTGYLGITAVSARRGGLYASASSLSAFAGTYLGCSSSTQTFTINGSFLYPSAGTITATAPAGFQVSNNGSTWGSTATYTLSGNTLTSSTVYARYTPTATGAASGNIIISGGGANPDTITVSGTGFGYGAVTGTASVCVGATTSLADTVTGGTWSSANTARATVDATTGVVTGVAAGTVAIRHSYPCGTWDSLVVTVNPLPVPGTITNTGSDSVLIGYTMTTLADATGGAGTWSSSTPAVATIDATTGVVTGVAVGSDTVKYSVTNGCGTAVAIRVIKVIKVPPVVTGVSPNTASPGTTVTIAGKYFSPTTTNNTVYFGATKATVSAASTTSLTVTVPVGATLAPVTVRTTDFNYTGFEDSAFTPTYTSSAFKTDTLNFKSYVAFNTTGAGSHPYGAAIGDIDGDGKPDLVVNNYDSSSVSVFINTSTAGVINASSFSLYGTTTKLSGKPNSLKLADLDGDGKLDVIVGLLTANNVEVLRNTTSSAGSPTFAGRQDFAAGTINAVPVIVDFDGDGLADVAVTLPAGAVGIFRNTSSIGSISFATVSTVTTATGSGGLCFADFDGDGKPDIATANSGSSYSGTTASVALNTSTVGTISFGTPISLTTGTGPVDITAADINGDGKKDLLVSNLASGSFSVFQNSSTTGSLSFGSAVNFAYGGVYTTGITVADLNGDGLADVVVSNAYPTVNTVTMFRNTGATGTISSGSFAAGMSFATATGPITVTIGDLDGDKYPDVVVGSNATNSVSVLRNYPLPKISPITGTTIVCAGGATTSLSDAVTGGTWSSTNPALATVDATTGVVTGVAAGTDTIKYTMIAGGDTTYRIAALTVNPLPVVSPITGISSICTGGSTTLNDATGGGTWNSSAPATATVDATTGVVTSVGITAATVVISYTTSNSCGSITALDTVTIGATPAVTPGATPSVCQGTTSASLSYSGATGAPTTYNLTYDATAHTAGFTDVTGGTLTGGTITLVVPAGAAAATYNAMLTVANGSCTSSSSAVSVTVVAYPSATITSAVIPCSGYTTNIVFTGTSGATVAYKLNSGSTANGTLTGGTYTYTTPAVTGADTIVFIDVHNATCTTLVGIDTIINPIPMQWTGTSDTDWMNTANWSCGFVPTSTDDVTIPAGTPNAPSLVAAGTGTTRNLTIAAGATVRVNSTATVNVAGKFSNNGNVAGFGKVSMSGSSAQMMSGIGAISNLDINNASGVSVDTVSRITIRHVLSISAGTLATNDSVVLASDSSATARISAITTAGAGITGKVQTMQYIAGGHRAFRFWGHPFSSAIPLSQLEKYIDITGNGDIAQGLTPTVTNAPSAFWYNPLVANSSMGYDPGWTAFTSALGTGANAFNQYEGIRLFIRGSKSEGLNGYAYTIDPVTIGMSGPVNQGALKIVMTKGTGTSQDYNQISNPYPSPVDIGTVAYNAWVAGNVTGAAIYIWNPYVGPVGQFVGVPITTGIPYNLEANTSFQIRAAHNGDTLNFAENNKAQTAALTVLKPSPEYVSLFVYDVNYNPWDMLNIQFNDQATDAEDNAYDALKPSGPAALNFYSLSSDNKKMTIDGRPYKADKVIPLGINSTYSQGFIIKAENVAAPQGAKIYLHDKLLNQYTLLTQGAEYRFSITTDKSTQGDDRFELSLDPSTAALQTRTPLQVNMLPNPATDDVTISFTSGKADKVGVRMLDLSGVSVYNKDLGVQQNGSVNVSLSNFAAGIYMVELTQGDQKVVQRLVKE